MGYAMFHCVKEEDGTVSITYAVHNIELEMQKKNLVSEDSRGATTTMTVDVESPIKDMEKYQRNKAKEMLKKLGVHLTTDDVAAASHHMDLMDRSVKRRARSPPSQPV